MSATDDYYEGDNQDANGVEGYDPDTVMKEEGQEVRNIVDLNFLVQMEDDSNELLRGAVGGREKMKT